MIGADRLPGVVNYFIGNDPAKWKTRLPTYAGVIYKQIYPGIDVRYDGTDGHVKGTYSVAPGADPHQIRWRYDGVSTAHVDTTGNLILPVSVSHDNSHVGTLSTPTLPMTLTEQMPTAWQDIAGRRIPVSVKYAPADESITFNIGSYDSTKPLIIDPTLTYSTFLGGTGDDSASNIGVDSAGNMYIGGSTTSTDFPTVTPPQRTYAGNRDALISKLSADGSTLIYRGCINKTHRLLAFTAFYGSSPLNG